MLHFDSRTITFSKQLTCVASWTNIPADSMLPDPSFSASCFIDLSGKGNVEELSACNWKKGQCLRKLLFPVMYEIFNFPTKEEGSEYLRRKWGQKILWASAGRGYVILQIWKEIIRKSSILLQWKKLMTTLVPWNIQLFYYLLLHVHSCLAYLEKRC